MSGSIEAVAKRRHAVIERLLVNKDITALGKLEHIVMADQYKHSQIQKLMLRYFTDLSKNEGKSEISQDILGLAVEVVSEEGSHTD